ncbi:uncharacterized protein LOC119094599 [Pollicipes pollicipes]|uniref:uncharacterized protein LOC119094599 n=1 Tax=Pollicipes pollicipes TaxID=41117 RepID=UPI0018859423|nr:uncharacterized protein LOC119094599 [Pollicipes pollicipes]
MPDLVLPSIERESDSSPSVLGEQSDEAGDSMYHLDSVEMVRQSEFLRQEDGEECAELAGNEPRIESDGCYGLSDSVPQSERPQQAEGKQGQDSFGSDDGFDWTNMVQDEASDHAVPSGQFGNIVTPADDLENLKRPGDKSEDVQTSGDDFGDFAVPTDNPDDLAVPPGDYRDFGASNDDFGDFAVPSDDFGDFAAPAGALASTEDAFGEFSGGDGGEPAGGFADFGAVFAASPHGEPASSPVSRQLADPADFGDDEFGDFERYQTPTLPEPTLAGDTEVFTAVLAGLFPLLAEEREPAATPLDSSAVWYQLRDAEATAALQYRWIGSRANTDLLRALRVDANNIISFGGWGGRAAGLFAAGLDGEPMQPTRGSPPERRHEQPAPAPREVPPAAFDWNSSGLKNPLEPAEPGSYSLLDLDVFDTNSSPAAAPNTFLSFPACWSSVAVVGMLGLVSHLSTAGPPLSEEASRLLARLPNIDFMQAKVLMFPVRGD